MAEPLLAIADLRAGYGSAVVLDGVSFDLAPQGGLPCVGRNGVVNQRSYSRLWAIRE